MTKDEARTLHRGSKVWYGSRPALVETVSGRDMYPPYVTLQYTDTQGGWQGWTAYQLLGVREEDR